MKKIFCFCFAISLISLFALASDKPAPSDPSMPVQTSVGKTFTVAMDANWTTGYQWQLAKQLDGAIVKRAGTQYLAGNEKLAGAPGIEIWSFEAVGTGETEISFKYIRAWEKDVPPAGEKKFKIIVAP